MSIAAPDWFKAASIEWSLGRATVQHTSQLSRFVQTVDLLAWQWYAIVTLPPAMLRDSGKYEALINSLAGGADTLALHHMARPYPLGTMRGAPTLSTTAAQFANSLSITTTAGATLKAGDMIGVSGQLFQVKSDCTASGAGALTVPLVNRSRRSITSGASVLWDKPTAEFYMMDPRSRSVYTPGFGGSQTIELVEKVA